MNANEHSRIITKAAKSILSPLGFRQKGRSRVWLADQGYWLTVVEFQPSGASKGSYLNVGLYWLWKRPPYVLSFDYGRRVSTFIKFENEAQFAPVAIDLVNDAARESAYLKSKFRSIEATAGVLIELEQNARRTGHGRNWFAYHAGVAAGLVGNSTVARAMFDSMLEATVPSGSLLHPFAQDLLYRVADTETFRLHILTLVNQQREHFDLAQLERGPEI